MGTPASSVCYRQRRASREKANEATSEDATLMGDPTEVWCGICRRLLTVASPSKPHCFQSPQCLIIMAFDICWAVRHPVLSITEPNLSYAQDASKQVPYCLSVDRRTRKWKRRGSETCQPPVGWKAWIGSSTSRNGVGPPSCLSIRFLSRVTEIVSGPRVVD